MNTLFAISAGLCAGYSFAQICAAAARYATGRERADRVFLAVLAAAAFLAFAILALA